MESSCTISAFTPDPLVNAKHEQETTDATGSYTDILNVLEKLEEEKNPISGSPTKTVVACQDKVR